MGGAWARVQGVCDYMLAHCIAIQVSTWVDQAMSEASSGSVAGVILLTATATTLRRVRVDVSRVQWSGLMSVGSSRGELR